MIDLYNTEDKENNRSGIVQTIIHSSPNSLIK